MKLKLEKWHYLEKTRSFLSEKMERLRAWWNGPPTYEPPPSPVPVGPSEPEPDVGEVKRALEAKRGQLAFKERKLLLDARDAKQRGDEARARTLLRQRAIIQRNGAQLDAQIQNLAAQELAVDAAEGHAAVAGAMRAGVARIRTATHAVDVDSVGELANEIQEAFSDVREIGDLLGEQLDVGTLYDAEEDIEATLAQWDDEIQVEQTSGVVDRLETLPVPTPGGSRPPGGGGRPLPARRRVRGAQGEEK